MDYPQTTKIISKKNKIRIKLAFNIIDDNKASNKDAMNLTERKYHAQCPKSQDNFIPRSANTPPIQEFSFRPGILSSIRANQGKHETSIFTNFYLPSCFTSVGQMFAGASIFVNS